MNDRMKEWETEKEMNKTMVVSFVRIIKWSMFVCLLERLSHNNVRVRVSVCAFRDWISWLQFPFFLFSFFACFL